MTMGCAIGGVPSLAQRGVRTLAQRGVRTLAQKLLQRPSLAVLLQ